MGEAVEPIGHDRLAVAAGWRSRPAPHRPCPRSRAVKSGEGEHRGRRLRIRMSRLTFKQCRDPARAHRAGRQRQPPADALPAAPDQPEPERRAGDLGRAGWPRRRPRRPSRTPSRTAGRAPMLSRVHEELGQHGDAGILHAEQPAQDRVVTRPAGAPQMRTREIASRRGFDPRLALEQPQAELQDRRLQRD